MRNSGRYGCIVKQRPFALRITAGGMRKARARELTILSLFFLSFSSFLF
jgi:hypothetical protein